MYSDNQYRKYKNFLNPNKDIISWSNIYSINNNQEYKYWPSSLIYLPFELDKVVSETTSTGIAAGFDLNDCIQSGLLELIERDSLMINF